MLYYIMNIKDNIWHFVVIHHSSDHVEIKIENITVLVVFFRFSKFWIQNSSPPQRLCFYYYYYYYHNIILLVILVVVSNQIWTERNTVKEDQRQTNDRDWLERRG